MSDSGKQWLNKVWRYRDCALPALGSLAVLLFMMFQPLSLHWMVKGVDRPAVDIAALLNAREEQTSLFKSAFEAAALDTNVDPQGRAIEVRRYTVEDWKSAVSSTGLVMWRYTSGLLAIALLCAALIAAYVIWSVPRDLSIRRRWEYTIALFLLGAGVFALIGFGLNTIEASTRFMRQFVGHIDSQLEGAALVRKELIFTYVGYVAAIYLLLASCINLAPFHRKGTERTLSAEDDEDSSTQEQNTEAEAEAQSIIVRLRYLHLILYVGAVVLAITTLRQKLMFKWSLDYLPPAAALDDKNPLLLGVKLIYERLDAIATSNVTASGILNTLLLAAMYVPAALVLQRRARHLSWNALHATRRIRQESAQWQTEKPNEEDEKPPPTEDDWMKAQGLTFPLKEQLPRIAAILAPLLAGPISELLVFLKR